MARSGVRLWRPRCDTVRQPHGAVYDGPADVRRYRAAWGGRACGVCSNPVRSPFAASARKRRRRMEVRTDPRCARERAAAQHPDPGRVGFEFHELCARAGVRPTNVTARRYDGSHLVENALVIVVAVRTATWGTSTISSLWVSSTVRFGALAEVHGRSERAFEIAAVQEAGAAARFGFRAADAA